MVEKNLATTTNDWREQVGQLQAELDFLLPQLVEAEAELAEQLAAINAFEFRLRAALSHLTRKLDALDVEIGELRRKLRLLGDAWYDVDDSEAAAWARGRSATEEGEYKYHDPIPKPRPQQDEDTRAELKRLYRQLAHYYHPDMAIDEEDRAYRTQMMMAINAAYAAGDLQKLRQLADAPEMARHLQFEHPDQQLAEALLRELARIQARLAEIEEELARLAEHESAKMMGHMADAEGQGVDYIGGLGDRLGAEIERKMVDRDGLLGQLEAVQLGEDTAVSDDQFADIVAEVTLDSSFDEAFPAEFERYIRKRQDGVYFEEDFDDDMGYE